MRDQLRPLLPFLQGIISRTYIPGQGQVEGQGECLDRHAVYMQGGRARKSLAYAVHTGDLNEDDCEALMYEVSRWALRGERWAGKGEEAPGTSVDDIGADETSTKTADTNALIAEDVEMKDTDEGAKATIDDELTKTEDAEAQPEVRRTPDTEPEDAGEKTATPEDASTITGNTHFHELIKRQPPRPSGAPDYEQLAPGERMGVSD
jgi:hypothetical protein